MKKEYFKLVVEENDFCFRNYKWDTLRFAWGGNWKQRFIIQSIIDLYWINEGQEIYNKFLAAIENIKNLSEFWEKTWIFVLYKNNYVPKE